MEIVCPSCNKANAGDPCARCGCELASLFAVREAAAVELATAAQHLRHSSPSAAAEAALRAWELHHTPEAACLGFLAGIAGGNFGVAAEWLVRC
jgi:hypothetical protein